MRGNDKTKAKIYSCTSSAVKHYNYPKLPSIYGIYPPFDQSHGPSSCPLSTNRIPPTAHTTHRLIALSAYHSTNHILHLPTIDQSRRPTYPQPSTNYNQSHCSNHHRPITMLYLPMAIDQSHRSTAHHQLITLLLHRSTYNRMLCNLLGA